MATRRLARMHKFRLYTGKPGTSLYLLVRLFPTQREMLAKLDGETSPFESCVSRRSRAVMVTECQMGLVGGRYRKSPCLGTANFCLTFLDTETVMHEFLHAVFAWAERKRLRPQTEPRHSYVEEHLCRAQGRFVRRFLEKAAALGLQVSDLAEPVPRALRTEPPWHLVRTDVSRLEEYVCHKTGVPPRPKKPRQWYRNRFRRELARQKGRPARPGGG